VIEQHRKLFGLDGVELEFTPDALDAIAQLALRRNAGAWGLRGIVEHALARAMYEIPSIAGVVITQEVVLLDPTLVRRHDDNHPPWARKAPDCDARTARNAATPSDCDAWASPRSVGRGTAPLPDR